MKPGRSKRRLVFALIGLAVIAVAIGAAVILTSGKISYTDDTVDVELIPPSSPAN